MEKRRNKTSLPLKARIALFLVALAAGMGVAQAQMMDPVKWTAQVNELGGGQAELVFKAAVDPGWHLYGMYFDEGGPLPTTLAVEPGSGFELVGAPIERPQPKKELDPIFGVNVAYFVAAGTFVQKIKITSASDITIKARVDGQACQDDGMCVLVGDDLSFRVKGLGQAGTETPGQTPGAQGETPAVSTDSLPATDSSQTGQAGPAPPVPPLDQAPASEGSVMDGGVMDLSKASLWQLFFWSFVAGLLAIFTPCVFPMLPMTVSYFMNNSQNAAKAKFEAGVYGLSIIGIYTIIGTLVAVLFGAAFANWLSTHWLPNVLFFLIFVVFAASFFGMFEITLPSWMINKSDAQADKGGVTGAFFMAFTLVLVSFSCTGPIVGAILVDSAGGQVLEPIVGMFGFSLAFAFPFTFFAFFPKMLSSLPKSGGWLNSVKVILGFIELALGLKFLSVADQTYHWGILDREVYIALWIVIFALMGLYLLGKLRFSHDEPVEHLKVPRFMLAILTFSFVVYLLPGMFGAPLKLLAGYLPPSSTHDFDINQIVRDNANIGSHGANAAQELCEAPLHADQLHLPHGLKGYFEYEQALACARAQGKPIFIDFTGHGCVNCRKMEENVWIDPEVLARLRENFVIVALYVDEKRIKLPEDEAYTSVVDGRRKTTLGDKYADFQIERFEVNAQPYYVLLDTDETLLAQPRAFDLNVEAFKDFLDRGLDEFNRRHAQP